MFDDGNDNCDDAPQDDRNPDDHRSLAQRLDLWHFQEEAPGMVFWHARGFLLYRLLEEAVRQVTAAQGYAEVRTPQILRRPVWEASGHWRHFAEGMFHVEDQAVPAAVKPVSCPGHLCLVQQRTPSYRELPLRFAELGLVHRDEPSGTLHGLMRLRQFTQDDGHIICAEDQAEAEALRFCQALPAFYRAFGFDQLSLALSTRPADRAGDDADWDRAEAVLESVLRRLGGPYQIQPGAGAFYGPKIEYALGDRLGRQWQCGTIQFDVAMPGRFDLQFVDASGQRRRPVMLHRALYGSLERFLAVLLEHHARALPPWLAPVQVAVLPLSDDQAPAAQALVGRLRAAGLRAQIDGDGTLSRRIAQAHAQAVPHQAVLGPREAAAASVTLRARDGQSTLPLEQAVARLAESCALPAFVSPGAAV
jgi:threonyl-tRNA synthetase